jgi:hypothetical protein
MTGLRTLVNSLITDPEFRLIYGLENTVTVITKEAMQALSQSPGISSLAVSGASGYDVLTNGKLSDFIIRKGGEKGGHGSCSGTFDDPKCGIGPGNP